MRVKRLELQGFKSFKDRTIIRFDHTITGIVGPNGCGKSNIVDAFFWVMGEQSYKHIRGSGSDDLIFNGSSKYTALNYAEATLVLESETVDTSLAPAGASFADLPTPVLKKEVSVTRRVYRGGEGEYFINGVNVRLKDVKELFMDTGVGAKGYSVIEQGQVARIINSKPEDRRHLIEEAAGIAKYKARKQESLRKLEAAQTNLARLKDIIVEIERNLASLERQAQRAKKHREYKDDLKRRELTLSFRRDQSYERKLENLKSEREKLEHENIRLAAELSTLENTLQVGQIEQTTLSKEIDEIQASLQKLSEELSTVRADTELVKHRHSDVNINIESFKKELAEIENQIVSLQNQIQEWTEESLQKTQEQSSLNDQIHGTERDIQDLNASMLALIDNVEETRQHYSKLIQEKTTLVANEAGLTSKLESVRRDLERIAYEKNALEFQTTEARDSIKNSLAEQTRLESHYQNLKAKIQMFTEKNNALEEKILQLKELRDATSSRLAGLTSKRDQLELLNISLEGVSEGPKAFLKWAKSSVNENFSDFSLLLESLTSRVGFEETVQRWLGHSLELIVTPRSEQIVSAMGAFNNQDESQVTVFQNGASRSELPGMPPGQKLLEKYGWKSAGKISDYLSVLADSKVHGITQEWLLSLEANCLVIENFNGRLPEQENFNKDFTVFALTGEVLHMTSSGVFYTIGKKTQNQTAALLKRKNEVAILLTEIEKTKSEESAVRANLLELESEQHLCQTDLDFSQEEARQIEVSISSLQHRATTTQTALEFLEKNLQKNSEDQQNALRSVSLVETQINETNQKQHQIETSRNQLETSLNQNDEKIKNLRVELSASEKNLQQMTIASNALNERIQSLQAQIRISNETLTSRSNRIREIGDWLLRLAREKEEFETKTQLFEEKSKELHTKIAEQREFLTSRRDRLEGLLTHHQEYQDQTRALRHQSAEIQTRSIQITVDIERCGSERGFMLQNLEEKYGIGCLQEYRDFLAQQEMPDPVVTAEMTSEEESVLAQELEELREKIRRLGEVNTLAIEEYEELQKRHERLNQERFDLEQSITNLQDAIEHINETSKERFKVAFEAIAKRFERLFPVVFGGGSAELSLIYPEGSSDILDAGVDILAQPPGKKVVNINVLSGGEKALTAVALLFGIFMVKPSPFCILDEVDAPLDDANIGKFNTLLREMSGKTQFILITHNKKTMELNNCLYGVTMEEPGVSKMISIELQ